MTSNADIKYAKLLEEVAEIIDHQDIRHVAIIQTLSHASDMAKEHGIVIARGYSDDLCLFSGAWDTDHPVYGDFDSSAAKIAISQKGPLVNPCGNDFCPYHKKVCDKARKLAIKGNFKTNKPHDIPVWALDIGEDVLYKKATLYEEGLPFTEVLLFYARDV